MTFVRHPPRRRFDELGAYVPNHFIIELDEEHQLLAADGTPLPNPSPDTVCLFVHEYMHYVQNISTIAGFTTFSLWQRVLALFSNTVDPAGESAGNAPLDAAGRAEVAGLLKLLDFAEGDVEPDAVKGREDLASIRVVGVRSDPWSVTLRDGECHRARVVLDCEVALSGGGNLTVEFQFGTAAIEEGIAYELDRFVAATAGRPAPDDAPLFPYLVLRELGLVHGPDRLSRIVLVACAVLSLQTTDPPTALLHFFDEVKALGAEVEPKIALAHLVEHSREHLQQTRDTALEDVERLVEMHRGRGATETAMRRVATLYSETFQMRAADPFWELRPFANNIVDRAALSQLLASLLPCDVLQARPLSDAADDDGEDQPLAWLLRFGAAPVSNMSPAEFVEHDDALRVMQCQLDYVQIHTGHRELVPSTAAAESGCPFFDSCTLALRRANEAICESTPWRIWNESREHTCWYGLGVASVVGEVRVDRRA